MASKEELKAFASEFYASFEELCQSYRESILGQFRSKAVMCRDFVSFLADLNTILNAENDGDCKAETERIIAGLNLVRLQRLANLLIKSIAGNELPPEDALLSALSRGGFSCFISASKKRKPKHSSEHIYRLVTCIFGPEFGKRWPKGLVNYPLEMMWTEGNIYRGPSGSGYLKTAIHEVISQMSLICALHSCKGRNTLTLINHASLHFETCYCMAEKQISDLTPSVLDKKDAEYMKEMFLYMFNPYALKSLEKLCLSLKGFNASESRTCEDALRKECATLRECAKCKEEDCARPEQNRRDVESMFRKMRMGLMKIPKRSTDYIKIFFAEPLYCVLMLKQVFSFISANRERIGGLDSDSGINEIWGLMPFILDKFPSRAEDHARLKNALRDWLRLHIYFFDKVSVSEKLVRAFVISGDEFIYSLLTSRLIEAFCLIEALKAQNDEVKEGLTKFLLSDCHGYPA